MRKPRRAQSKKRREALIGYAFILPALVVFALFRFEPGVGGIVLSLFDYQPLGGSTFQGLDNYRRLLDDETFRLSFRVTLTYTFLSVPLIVAAALGMAVLCNRAVRGISLFRSLFFLPVITSLVLAGVLWRWIYGLHGPLNEILGVAGVGAVPWIQSTTLVLPSLAIMSLWNRFGFAMLILLAALQTIPREYHEAAAVDGASTWARFRDITLPLLKPALFLVIVLETIESVQIFDAIYVMTGGGPARASYSLLYMLYDQAFTFADYGYAATIGVIMFAATLAIALAQRRLIRGWQA